MLKRLRKVLMVCLFVACVLFMVYTPCVHLFKRDVFASINSHQASTVAIKLHTSAENFQNCSIRTVKLSENPLPITGLVSFPGSGNTWTRHLIQQMSGLGTSSCYCDDTLGMNGFPYECYDKLFKTVVVKTHEFQHVQQYKFKKIVLLIRNPYEAIVSYANFIKRRHTGHASSSVLKPVVSGTFSQSLRWYVDLTKATIGNFSGPVHIIQYEKLETEMSDTLWKLAKFLNVNITQRNIDCTVKLQEGNFHRKTSEEERLQLLKEVYNKEQLLQLKDATDYTEKLIKEAYGLDLDIGSPVERVLLENIR